MRFSCAITFFFSSRSRHTRLQGDWSSDVCSSDLVGQRGDRAAGRRLLRGHPRQLDAEVAEDELGEAGAVEPLEIGRASCRERGSTPRSGGTAREQKRNDNRTTQTEHELTTKIHP